MRKIVRLRQILCGSALRRAQGERLFSGERFFEAPLQTYCVRINPERPLDVRLSPPAAV